MSPDQPPAQARHSQVAVSRNAPASKTDFRRIQHRARLEAQHSVIAAGVIRSGIGKVLVILNIDSAADYLLRTESAARTLLDGIGAYVALLKQDPLPIFSITSTDENVARDAFNNWLTTEGEQIRRSLKSQREFFVESFALSTLSGCLLQVAAKGIELFSCNTDVPEDFCPAIKPSKAAVPFCIGRSVRAVPIGLIIYAGRNQFAHLEERDLREPNATIFDRLSLNHGGMVNGYIKDPPFNLQNEQVVNFAGNITGLLGWRDYDAYVTDMRRLLNVAD